MKIAKPVALDPSQAKLVGFMGLALMASGVVAVFSTELEAGPVALLGLGLLFFFVGLAGRLPARLKFGDTEIELGELQEIAEDLVEVTPAAERQQLLKRLNELNTAIPNAATPAIEGLFFQQLVTEMLRDLMGESNVELEAGTRRWDLIINGAHGDRLVVDIVAGGNRTSSYFRQIIRQFDDDRQTLRADKLLIVVRSKPSVIVLEEVSRLPSVSIVVIGGTEDQLLLRHEILRLIQVDALRE